MNTFLNGLKYNTNFTLTENGGLTHKSTMSKVLDLFGLGGAYRWRDDADCIDLFKPAFKEDPELAVKCLFYLRDIREGAGERRFFRVCFKWLIENEPEAAAKLIEYIPEFGRWDDIYVAFDTPLEDKALTIIRRQLEIDLTTDYPSLCGKWLKSINATSEETCRLGEKTRKGLGLSQKEYRKMLARLRDRINVLEGLMSRREWNKIDFSKIPSIAGYRYANTFTYKNETRDRYLEFINNKDTKVNATVLDPVAIADKVIYGRRMETSVLQKYWDNLKDYYNGREERGIAVVDVSGSMAGTPMAAAVGMGMYIAERGAGPFKDHFITFSGNPDLVEITGDNIVEKMQNCISSGWGFNTNMEKVLELILNTAVETNCPEEEMPERLYIFSDMHFDIALSDPFGMDTLFEAYQKKFAECGYRLPQVIFWNLRAAGNVIPAIGEGFSYVSGFSLNMLEGILSGLDGYDLMLAKLESPRYEKITLKERNELT